MQLLGLCYVFHCTFFFLTPRRPPISTLFPYTTLFRSGKDVNSHTVLDGIITTIMATIQRINIIGSREGKSVDRKSGSAGMPRPISYAVFCLKKKKVLPKLQCVFAWIFDTTSTCSSEPPLTPMRTGIPF